jgi:hypothetical protein
VAVELQLQLCLAATKLYALPAGVDTWPPGAHHKEIERLRAAEDLLEGVDLIHTNSGFWQNW